MLNTTIKFESSEICQNFTFILRHRIWIKTVVLNFVTVDKSLSAVMIYHISVHSVRLSCSCYLSWDYDNVSFLRKGFLFHVGVLQSFYLWTLLDEFEFSVNCVKKTVLISVSESMLALLFKIYMFRLVCTFTVKAENNAVSSFCYLSYIVRTLYMKF